MKSRLFLIKLLGLIFSLSCSVQVSAQSGLPAPVAVGAYLNGSFPSSAPGNATGWTYENAFPNLTFIDPLWLTQVPNTNDLLLVGKGGMISRFDKNVNVQQGDVVQVLDWVSKTQSSEDQGFYSLVFHPNFGQSGQVGEDYVYVCYNHRPGSEVSGQGNSNSLWRVSRFTWLTASGTIDAASEYVFINQYDPDLWHNGGAMYFDNDGFLNVACGDGGDSGSGGGLSGALGRTQILDDGMFSGIFRIDVDNDASKSHAIRRQPQDPNGFSPPSGWTTATNIPSPHPNPGNASYSQGYGIPNTNPFLDVNGGILEEYFVLGLRSPHTAHYDTVENEVWVGDVGEGSYEELSALKSGDNAQWGYMEGTGSGPGNPASPAIGTNAPPLFAYDGNTGSCIIGGMRYRGNLWSSQLGGKVVYGDHLEGKVWTATLDESGNLLSRDLIIEGFHTGGKRGLGNFCTDDAGEVYLMDLNGTNNSGGTIQRLVLQGSTAEPPALLSQTGLFSNLATLATAAGVIPYDVATPLWSDAAHKYRWIAVPNDGTHDTAAEQITFSEEGNWVFPAGTVIIKHFELNTDENNPATIRRLETRFLVCLVDGGIYGVTYKWRPDGSDADLMTDGESEIYTITLAGGGTVPQNWDYPSRGDCLQCHTTAAGQALGVRTMQMNMDHHYNSSGITANQLVTFNALGMFDQNLGATQLANFIEARAIDDPTAPLEHRVRSYLDSNCSHCHQPDSTVEYFDARLGTPLVKQGIIGAAIQGHYNLPGGNYIKPGDTALSAVYVRASNVNNGAAMPPLAKNLIDPEAVSLIQTYIDSLTDTEFQITSPAPNAQYVRLTATDGFNQAWTTVGEFSILDGSGKPIPTADLSIHDFDSQELNGENAPATRAIDGSAGTYWHTEWDAASPTHPHHITLNLGSLRSVGGYIYTPRQDNGNGRISDYEVHYSSDGTNWTLMDSGTWPNSTDLQSFDGLVGKRKARCEVAGPVGVISGDFEVTIAFDTDVTDFTGADLQVNGGTVTSLRGSGYYYVATITPSVSTVTVQVPTDSANSTGVGSFASNLLNLGDDIFGPVASFTGIPSGIVSGPFILGIEFDEVPTGFSMASLSASNANLAGLMGSGTSYTVLVSPAVEGAFTVTLDKTGIVDDLSQPMVDSVSVTPTYASEVLYTEAEAGTLAGGMVAVSDAGASAGSYVWLPNGSAAGNENSFNSANSATYNFVLPYTGNWILEGLLRSDDTDSDSLWVKIDGGATYTWNTNEGSVGSNSFAWDQLSSGSTPLPTVTLIDAITNNGSFESLGGSTVSTAKATEWDGDSDGDVDNWTQLSGPDEDSGTDVHADATDGARSAFLEDGNSVYNQTSHIVAEGEVYSYTWDWTLVNRGDVTTQLAYWDGTNVVPIAGTATMNPNNTSVHLGLGTSWTVTAGHAAIGQPMVLMVTADGYYPHIDNFELVVNGNALAEDPVVLNLPAGSHTVTVYGREDGTRLDALRFVSEAPTVTLTAPATISTNNNVSVDVSFSEDVTDLTIGDFSVAGATIASLTGSGDSYVLTLTPTGTYIAVNLPADRVIDANSNGNYASNAAGIDVISIFDQWAQNAGLGNVGFEDDSNNDGYVALLEFALNLDPNTNRAPVFDSASGPTGMPKVYEASDRLYIEFPRNKAAIAAGYRYIAQFSSDLSTWTNVEVGTVTSMDAEWDKVVIEDPQAATGVRRFARLEVVSP